MKVGGLLSPHPCMAPKHRLSNWKVSGTLTHVRRYVVGLNCEADCDADL